MLFYLILMLFIAMVISILIYIGIAGMLASDSASGVIAGPASKSDQVIALPWHSLKISVLLLLASGFLISAGLGYAWYRISSRMLERPVRIVLRALDQLARGQLNETVSILTIHNI